MTKKKTPLERGEQGYIFIDLCGGVYRVCTTRDELLSIVSSYVNDIFDNQGHLPACGTDFIVVLGTLMPIDINISAVLNLDN